MSAVGERLVIATHNEGKLREIRALVAPFGITCLGAAELGLAEPEETGTSFIANAELKARAAADLSGLPALSDDSGLSVDALGGEPGIHSARWAEDESGRRDFGYAMAKVAAALPADASRDAHFTCALTLAWPDGRTESFEGKVFGTLIDPPRGENGFGYDAMFVPNGHDESFGEMHPDAKHAMSHRALAFEQLVSFLRR